MFKNNNRPVLVLGIFLVTILTVIIFRPIVSLGNLKDGYSSSVPSSAPTPTPALILLTSEDDNYSFIIPASWSAESSTIAEKASIANLKACDDIVLSIRELPALDPQTNRSLSAKTYLSLSTNPEYSTIDGLRTIVVSEASPSGDIKPYARAVIESTPSGQLVDFYYQPTCFPDLETGKQKEFYPLLNSIRFKSNF